MDELDEANTGRSPQLDQCRRTAALPEEIAGMEEDVVRTRGGTASMRGRGAGQPWAKKASDQPLEAPQAEISVRQVVVSQVGQQAPGAAQPHRRGEETTQAGDGARAFPVVPEAHQEIAVDAVETVAAQDTGDELDLARLAQRCGVDEPLRHPLDAGRMTEIGVPVQQPGHIEQEPARGRRGHHPARCAAGRYQPNRPQIRRTA